MIWKTNNYKYINETWVLQDSINTNFTAVNARFICYTYLVLIFNNFCYFSELYLIYLWIINWKWTISNMFTDNHFYLAFHSIQHFIYFQEYKEHYFIFKLKKWVVCSLRSLGKNMYMCFLSRIKTTVIILARIRHYLFNRQKPEIN